MTYRHGLPVIVTFPDLGPCQGTIIGGPVARDGKPVWKIQTRSAGEDVAEVWVPEAWLSEAVRGV